MYCSYCREKIDDNDKICKSCEKDLKSTDKKIEKTLYSSILFCYLRFFGKISFILFLFTLIHFPEDEKLIVFSLLFSVITNCIC